MKKQYQKPAMRIVRIEHQQIICNSGDPVSSVNSGDTGIGYGGGSHGPNRARSFGGWDDEDWDDWDE